MRRYFFDWLFYVVMWTIVTLFINFIYISLANGIIEFFELSKELSKNPMSNYFVSYKQYIEAFLFGLLFGTSTFGINLAVESTSIHRLSFGKTIIIKTVLYFLAIALITILMYGIIITSGMSPLDAEEFRDYLRQRSIPSSLIIGVGFLFFLSTMLINFIALIVKKFGPGHMFQIFLGRFHKPLTENRVFMFLDLKASTTIAEKLGHIIYSKLLQKCFLDLNKPIPNSRAGIHQYVGDEAVLTWKIKNYESNFIRPVQLFFAFKKRLEKREKYYLSKFGGPPRFKAGINAGVVTVAEIGDLKREIAYHGDVVNTASRLRSACNEFDKEVLASEYVVRNSDATIRIKWKKLER